MKETSSHKLHPELRNIKNCGQKNIPNKKNSTFSFPPHFSPTTFEYPILSGFSRFFGYEQQPWSKPSDIDIGCLKLGGWHCGIVLGSVFRPRCIFWLVFRCTAARRWDFGERILTAVDFRCNFSRQLAGLWRSCTARSGRSGLFSTAASRRRSFRLSPRSSTCWVCSTASSTICGCRLNTPFHQKSTSNR